jgi:predicted phosphohydrolase
MHAAWLTDIHLNFLDPPALAAFEDRLQQAAPDAVLLGGDIGEAPNVSIYLRRLAATVPCPVYFVLGNHDFYRGSITGVRHEVAQLCSELPRLVYLTAGGAVELTPHVGLVGHDGWADGRAGSYRQSDVLLNDYFLIGELAWLDSEQRLERLQQLGDEAAAHIRKVLPMALEQYQQAIVLTHVPPFHEACWHQGRLSDDNWAPHFTCLAMGDALREIAGQLPHRQITVLCGHTHSPGEARLSDNLLVLTAALSTVGRRFSACLSWNEPPQRAIQPGCQRVDRVTVASGLAERSAATNGKTTVKQVKEASRRPGGTSKASWAVASVPRAVMCPLKL